MKKLQEGLKKVSNENLEDIKRDFLERYLAQDGGMRLDIFDDREPFPPCQERTVKNQNPAMFLSETLLAFKARGVDISFHRNRTLSFLKKITVQPGVFSRRPFERVFMDSHDNMLGIVALCALYGFDDILLEIVTHGERSGWVYNNLASNTDEAQRSLSNYFIALRQGKDIAVYKVAVGRRPYLLETLWLIGSALVPGSDLRLLRLRTKVCQFAAKRFKDTVTGSFLSSLHAAMSLIYMLRGGDKKYREVVADYFKDPDHPMRRLWA